MPIHLLPLTQGRDAELNRGPTRRAFLGRALAGGLGLAAGARWARGAEPTEGRWFALLSDTHIAADPKAVSRGNVMAENLEAVVRDILAQAGRPRAAFVDGDLALNHGESGDYATFVGLVKPLREAGVPLHLGLGNHDDRAHFRASLRAEPAPDAAVVDKHVSVVDAPGLRFIILDSLDRPNVTPGVLGERQLGWLGRTLDAAADRPTLLFVHHNLSDQKGALTDTPALLNIIRPRKQVKAVVYGHSHRWERAEDEGIHLINLPAIAYPFGADQPLGWVKLRPSPTGADLELRCVGGNRAKDGERVELTWRA